MNAMPRSATVDPIADVLVELAARTGSGVVIDVGGGSGTSAVPLARLGCTVVVVDSSIDALAILGRRAADAGVADRVTGLQADAAALDTVVPAGSADLVLCHHLLETVDDPAATVAGITAVLKPGGIASVLVAGRYAAVLAQAAAGRFGDASAMLADPDGRFGNQDPLRRRFDVAGLEQLLAGGGLQTEVVIGVGVLSGLPMGGHRSGGRPGQGNAAGQSRAPGAALEPPVADLEAQLSQHRQLREIATDLHAVASRTG
jgi:S-adenosylmethionine-dependent methyltransferase